MSTRKDKHNLPPAPNKLIPVDLWNFFSEICKIPRPSKKEEKIRNYLSEFARRNELPAKTDKAGNLLISKPASPGLENKATIVLQSHLDMVCEKNADIQHDFNKDEIKTRIDGEWMKAQGTTLGADDGIGIAATLAVLASDEIKHGPLECLFTVEEESGLKGAQQLEPGFMTGKILLNLDSEDEGEIFIGCAGGIDTIATFPFTRKKVPSEHIACEISVKGLHGGHSGDDIHINTGNSIIILNRILIHASELFKIRLANFDGGNLVNAIPREAIAIFTIKKNRFFNFKVWFSTFIQEIKAEYYIKEPDLVINLKVSDDPEYVINKKSQLRFSESIYACPNGVIAWSSEIEGLVETSSNLASVKYGGNNNIVVTTNQRSSVESSKNNISSRIRYLFELAGAGVIHRSNYPGWKPVMNSEILRIAQNTYNDIFSTKPKIKAIHAGLECGLFLEKYPDLDMISFGPTIKGAHSPDERIHIPSTLRFWRLLSGILENIPG